MPYGFEQIPDDYRLSFLVGEIARWDVWGENEMRSLCRVLERSDIDCPTWAANYGDLIPQLLKTLEKSLAPGSFRKLVAQVGTAALKWHRLRGRYVHDLWIQTITDSHQAIGLKSDYRATVSLSEFDQCVQELQRVSHRLRALWIIAPSWLDINEDWRNAEDLRSWTRVAMNQIADDPGRIRGTPGKCPEPEGGYASVGDQ